MWHTVTFTLGVGAMLLTLVLLLACAPNGTPEQLRLLRGLGLVELLGAAAALGVAAWAGATARVDLAFACDAIAVAVSIGVVTVLWRGA